MTNMVMSTFQPPSASLCSSASTSGRVHVSHVLASPRLLRHACKAIGRQLCPTRSHCSPPWQLSSIADGHDPSRLQDCNVLELETFLTAFRDRRQGGWNNLWELAATAAAEEHATPVTASARPLRKVPNCTVVNCSGDGGYAAPWHKLQQSVHKPGRACVCGVTHTGSVSPGHRGGQ